MSKGVYKHKRHSKEWNREIGLALMGTHRIGYPLSEEHKRKIRIGMIGKMKGKKKPIGYGEMIRKRMLGTIETAEHKHKISLALKGKMPKYIPHGWNKGIPMLPELKEKLRLSHLGKKGSLSGNWKGGITPINMIIRSSEEYKLWRLAVFARDNYTCIWCGEKGKKLNADHIKPFAYFPELRFAIDNGRTLCVDCHKTTETYAGKGNKRI